MKYIVRWTEHYELEVEAENEREAENEAMEISAQSSKGFVHTEIEDISEIPTRIHLKEGDEIS